MTKGNQSFPTFHKKNAPFYNLTFVQLLTKFLYLYETQRSFTLFATPRHRCQFNPHLTPHSFNINFNIISLLKPTPSMWLLPSKFSDQSVLCMLNVSIVSPSLITLINFGPTLQITKRSSLCKFPPSFLRRFQSSILINFVSPQFVRTLRNVNCRGQHGVQNGNL